MVLLLILNVSSHTLATRCANCERAITILPTKLLESNSFTNPTRRVGLDIAQKVGDSMVWRKTDQAMNMVCNPADFVRHSIRGAESTAKPGMQPQSPFPIDVRFVVFCTKYDVNMQARVGGTHDSRRCLSSLPQTRNFMGSR